MHWKTLFKSDQYISAVELEGKKPTLTIARVQSAKLEQEDGREKDKAVMYFKEISRGFVFSRTVGHCVSAMFGDDIAGWIGRRVTLHAEMVQVGDHKEPGIRVTGSPDLEKALTIKVKLPKRKAVVVKLIPTQAKGGELPTEQQPQPEPQQPATGEA